jgi:hypothetical protein
MTIRTGNHEVVEQLQTALESFLKDHRTAAETESQWADDTKGMTSRELEELSGCGCKDCQKAGELLGSIKSVGQPSAFLLQ